MNSNIENKEWIWNNFNIQICENINLYQLRELFDQWFPVIRSAHIGNQYPSNLSIMHFGLPSVLYDRTILSKDKNYKPWSIIYNWEEIEIFEKKQDKISILSRLPKSLNLPHHLDSDIFNIVSNSDWIWAFHYEVTKKTFPETEIITFSQWLDENKEIVLKVISTLFENIEKSWDYDKLNFIFDRYILPNWEILTVKYIDDDYMYFDSNTNSYWSSLKIKKSELIERFEKSTNAMSDIVIKNPLDSDFNEIRDEIKWPILSNIINTILFWIIDSIKYNKDTVYHCSWPDMVNYIENFWKIYNELYSILLEKSDLKIPATLNFNIVPTANIKLLSLDKNIRTAINDLFVNNEKLSQISIEKWIQIKELKSQWITDIKYVIAKYSSLIEKYKSQNKELIKLIKSTFCSSYLFDHIWNTSNYFSQFDLYSYSESERNEIFEKMWSINMSDLKKQLSFLKKNF